eukprot:1560596-Prorocentrum_lima.AAC.1
MFRYGVHALCVDVVVDATLGDLTEQRAISFWEERIMSGEVAGVLAGPPCESWSAARWVVHDDGPVPLRST